MARVIPIDIIKGISGKYGKNADFYFATNTSSGKIRISQLPKPSHRPPTEKQKAQRLRFAARHAAVTAWLNANKPSELNGPKGTEAYQLVQRLKRKLDHSLINQVLLKYMDEDNVIRLPETKEQRNRNLHKPEKPYFFGTKQKKSIFLQHKFKYILHEIQQSTFEIKRRGPHGQPAVRHRPTASERICRRNH
ncbi:MAG: hypothetical protein MJZ91_00140 [Bacteroidales bacterium]|nr:hypothetical protein [Bacteroidales bacterium]